MSENMPEEWRAVPGYEGRYEVSSHGRVKSVGRPVVVRGNKFRPMPEKIMSLCNHGNGYKVIWLRSPGLHKKFYIHRLVAAAFIPNTYGKDVVNHIDCNKHNNNISNLEWMTFSENTRYYYDTEREKVRLSNENF